MKFLKKIFTSSPDRDGDKFVFVNMSDIILSVVFLGTLIIATSFASSVTYITLGILNILNLVGTSILSAISKNDMFISPLFRPISVLAYKISTKLKKKQNTINNSISTEPKPLPKKKYSKKKELSMNLNEEKVQNYQNSKTLESQEELIK